MNFFSYFCYSYIWSLSPSTWRLCFVGVFLYTYIYSQKTFLNVFGKVFYCLVTFQIITCNLKNNFWKKKTSAGFRVRSSAGFSAESSAESSAGSSAESSREFSVQKNVLIFVIFSKQYKKITPPQKSVKNKNTTWRQQNLATKRQLIRDSVIKSFYPQTLRSKMLRSYNSTITVLHLDHSTAFLRFKKKQDFKLTNSFFILHAPIPPFRSLFHEKNKNKGGGGID